jgi:hypothetical protein
MPAASVVSRGPAGAGLDPLPQFLSVYQVDVVPPCVAPEMGFAVSVVVPPAARPVPAAGTPCVVLVVVVVPLPMVPAGDIRWGSGECGR